MEHIEEKEQEARNFISQYHTNWNEDKDVMKALDKIKQLVASDDENTISSAKESQLGLKDAIQQERQAQSYIKLKDLVMERKDSKIEYLDPESKKAVFIDRGQHVIAKTDDKAAIAVMLEYAKEKYGGSLKLNGTEEFKKQCAEVAAEKGMNIIIHPDKYHQMMMDRKAEMAASIEAGPQQESAVAQSGSLSETKATNELDNIKGQQLADNEPAQIDPEKESNVADSGQPAPSDAFEGERNPLGTSSSRFDEVRDIPAYMRNPVEKGAEPVQESTVAQSGSLSEKSLTEQRDIDQVHDVAAYMRMSENEKAALLDKLYLNEGIFKQNFEQAISEADDISSIDDVIAAAKIINEYNSDVTPQTPLEFKSAFERLEKRYEGVIDGNKSFNWKLDTLLAAREELNTEREILTEQYLDAIGEDTDAHQNVKQLDTTLEEQISAAQQVSDKQESKVVAPQTRQEYTDAFERLARQYEAVIKESPALEVDELAHRHELLNGERETLTTQYLDAARGDPYENAHEKVERLDLDLCQVIEWKILDKEKMDDNTREELLNEFQQAHADRGLPFERDFERDEINFYSEAVAREYLQDALDGRTERANGQDKPEQEMDR